MLIRFQASNYRSIREPIELSMVAIDKERVEARLVPELGVSLLPVSAIFGPNASGKSNIISAFAWLQDAVQSSLRTWDDEIPVDVFAFGDGWKQPSGFNLELAIKGVRFEYVLELEQTAVLYEGLFYYPEKKRRRIFERIGREFKLQRGLGNLSGTRELLTDRTLALSVARRFDEPLVSGFASELLRSQTLGLKSSSPQRVIEHRSSTVRWLEGQSDNEQPSLFEVGNGSPPLVGSRARALALLQLADLGIDDVVIDQQEVSIGDRPQSSGSFARQRIRLVHRSTHGRVPLDFSSESEGTRTWFGIIGPVLTSLNHGSLLLFDELDASLHPTLSSQLIDLFHDPMTNPLGAQLVFTSHDTSLLNHLNRDEVWLTEKEPDGSTRLGALADFAGERVRQSQNLERGYLQGRFGALPDIDRTELLRALGLIG